MKKSTILMPPKSRMKNSEASINSPQDWGARGAGNFSTIKLVFLFAEIALVLAEKLQTRGKLLIPALSFAFLMQMPSFSVIFNLFLHNS